MSQKPSDLNKIVAAQREKDFKLQDDVERMRKERGDILEEAKALSLNLKKLEDDYAVGLDFGKSPEEMTKLFMKFESNADKAFRVLDDVNEDFGKVKDGQTELEELLSSEDNYSYGFSHALEQEIKDRRVNSTSKINDLFLRVKKQHNDMMHSFANDLDQDIRVESQADVEAALVPILQRKCTQLKKDVETAESRARSITAQWAADKKKFEELMTHNQRELIIMSQKLQQAESKARFLEQVSRDENSVSSMVSRIEFDEVVQEAEILREKVSTLEDELSIKSNALQKLQQEVSNLQLAKAELERTKQRQETKIEELNKKYEHQRGRENQAHEEGEKRLQELHKEFENAFKDSRGRVDHLERELATKLAQTNDLELSKAHLEKSIQSLESEARQLRDRLQFIELQLRRQQEEMSEAVSASQTELSKYKLENKILNGEKVGMQKMFVDTLASVQRATLSRSGTLAKLEAETQNLLDSQAAKIKGLEEYIHTLQKRWQQDVKNIEIGMSFGPTSGRPLSPGQLAMATATASSQPSRRHSSRSSIGSRPVSSTPNRETSRPTSGSVKISSWDAVAKDPEDNEDNISESIDIDQPNSGGVDNIDDTNDESAIRENEEEEEEVDDDTPAIVLLEDSPNKKDEELVNQDEEKEEEKQKDEPIGDSIVMEVPVTPPAVIAVATPKRVLSGKSSKSVNSEQEEESKQKAAIQAAPYRDRVVTVVKEKIVFRDPLPKDTKNVYVQTDPPGRSASAVFSESLLPAIRTPPPEIQIVEKTVTNTVTEFVNNYISFPEQSFDTDTISCQTDSVTILDIPRRLKDIKNATKVPLTTSSNPATWSQDRLEYELGEALYLGARHGNRPSMERLRVSLKIEEKEKAVPKAFEDGADLEAILEERDEDDDATMYPSVQVTKETDKNEPTTITLSTSSESIRKNPSSHRIISHHNSVSLIEGLVEEDVVEFAPSVRHQACATDISMFHMEEMEGRARNANRLKVEIKSLRRQIAQLEKEAEAGSKRDGESEGFDAGKWMGLIGTEEGSRYVEEQLEKFLQKAAFLVDKDSEEEHKLDADRLAQIQKRKIAFKSKSSLFLQSFKNFVSSAPIDPAIDMLIQQPDFDPTAPVHVEPDPNLDNENVNTGPEAGGDMEGKVLPALPEDDVYSEGSGAAGGSLSIEELMKTGEVRRENFERLKNKGFGSSDIVDLSVLDYYVKYYSTTPGNASKTMQMRTLLMERDALRWKVISKVPIEDLARARKASESHLTLLSTFDAWKRVLHFTTGGQFRDILEAHRDNLDATIETAGGWPKAMQRVKRRNNPEEDTSMWPDFFRIKVLEVFRKELLDQKMHSERNLADLKLMLQTVSQNMATSQKIDGKTEQNADRSWAYQQITLLERELQNAISRAAAPGIPVRPAVAQSPLPTTENRMPPMPRGSGSLTLTPIPVSEPLSPSTSSGIPNTLSFPQPLLRAASSSFQTLHHILPTIHRVTDRAALGVIRQEQGATQFAEALVQFIGNWMDGEAQDAMTSLKTCETASLIADETSLVKDLGMIFSNSMFEVPTVVMEVFDKLEGILETVDDLAEYAKVKEKEKEQAINRMGSTDSYNGKLSMQKNGSAKLSSSNLMSKGSGTWGKVKLTKTVGSSFNRSPSSSIIGMVEHSATVSPTNADSANNSSIMHWKDKVNERIANRRGREELKEKEKEKRLRARPTFIVAPKSDMSTQTVFDLDISFAFNEEEEDDDSSNDGRVMLNGLQAESSSSSDSIEVVDNGEGAGLVLKEMSPVTEVWQEEKIDVPTVVPFTVVSISRRSSAEMKPSGGGDLLSTNDTAPKDADGIAAAAPPPPVVPKPVPHPMHRGSSKRLIAPKSMLRLPKLGVDKGLKLLPPFHVVSLGETGELELCPGVTLCTRVDLPASPSPPMPRGLWIVRKDETAVLLPDMEEAPSMDRVMPGPLPDPFPAGYTAMWLPPVIPLAPGLSFVPGIDFGPLLELPQGVIIVRLEEGSSLLPGMQKVNISPRLELADGYIVPPGLRVVQSDIGCALPSMYMEGGILLGPGVESAAIPPGSTLTLPPNVMLVKHDDGVSLPDGLQYVVSESSRDQLQIDSYMTSGARILRRPPGLDLPLGMELLQRPPDVPFPSGMTIAQPSSLPAGLKLPAGVEVIQLPPFFDLPPGVLIGPNVEIFPRPPFMKLPRNVYLVSRGLGAPIPAGFRAAPMPLLPHGVSHFPAGVEALEMIPGAHLASGTDLAPGMVVAECPPDIKLPTGVELVRRQQWAECPPGIEKGLRNDLPPGTRLPQGIEVVRFVPRFELPAGVLLGAGAELSKNVQLAPGTDLGMGLETIQWPYGVYLPPNVELVRLPGGKGEVPLPFRRVDIDLPEGVEIPPGCVPVRLPTSLKLQSARQLAENIEIVEPSPEFGLERMPRGVVLIKHIKSVSSTRCLPAEMSLLSASELPNDLKIPPLVHAVRLAPRFEIPAGVELSTGVEVVPCPCGLLLPPNLVIVKIRTGSPLPAGVEPVSITLPDGCVLPEDATVVTFPPDIRIHSWGWQLSVGMTVECPKHILLPHGAQLVERRTGKSTNDLPPGIRYGTFADLAAGTTLPPGVQMVFLPQRFYLPQCVAVKALGAIPPMISLAANEKLCSNVSIATRPYNLILPPCTELVRFDSVAQLPPDITIINTEESNTLLGPLVAWFPPACYGLVKLPPVLSDPRQRQLKITSDGSVAVGGVGGESTPNSYGKLGDNLKSDQPLTIHVLMRILPGMYPDPRYRERENNGGHHNGGVESKQHSQERELLERNNAVLKRETKDLHRKIARVTASLEELKIKANRAEEAVVKAENREREIRSDLQILRIQSTQTEASLRSRLADLEANKSRLLQRVREMQLQVDGLTAQVKLWKSAQQELQEDLLQEAIARGRVKHLGEIAAARNQTHRECRKVIIALVKTLCKLVGNALHFAFDASVSENQQLLDTIMKFQEAEEVERLMFTNQPYQNDISKKKRTIIIAREAVADGNEVDEMNDDSSLKMSLQGSVSETSSVAATTIPSQLQAELNSKLTAYSDKQRSHEKLIEGGGTPFVNRSGLTSGYKQNRSLSLNGQAKADVDSHQLYTLSAIPQPAPTNRSTSPTMPMVSTTATSSTLVAPLFPSQLTAAGATGGGSGGIYDRFKREGGDVWEPLFVHVEQLRNVKRPFYDPEKQIVILTRKLDGIFSFTKEDVGTKKTSEDPNSTEEKVDGYASELVVDLPAAEELLSIWSRENSGLFLSYIDALFGKHLEALRLAEIEIRAQTGQRRSVMRKNKHLSSMLNEERMKANANRPGGDGTPNPLDTLRKDMTELQTRFDELLLQGQQPLLELLKLQATQMKDMSELHHRLTLCALVKKKLAEEEQSKLQRMTIKQGYQGMSAKEEEQERKASMHLFKNLQRQAADLIDRAETVKAEGLQLQMSMYNELADFEGAVQGVLKPQTLAKLLHWGNSRHQQAALIQQLPVSLSDKSSRNPDMSFLTSVIPNDSYEEPLSPSGTASLRSSSSLTDYRKNTHADALSFSSSLGLDSSNLRGRGSKKATGKRQLEALPAFLTRPTNLPSSTGLSSDDISNSLMTTMNPPDGFFIRKVARGLPPPQLSKKR